MTLMTTSSWCQFVNENFTYQDGIKSVVVSVNGTIESVPALRLGLNDFMVMTFDDLNNSEDDFYYKLIHCDRNWKKTEMNELDYIDGFNDEVFRVWEFSEVTEVEFTHYWIQLPNRDTRFKISGNYLLHVYQKDGEDLIPMLTRRFVVTENLGGTSTERVRSSQVDIDRFYQQFDITSFVPDNISNPMNDVSIEVIQNGLWNESVKNVKPFSLNGNALKFDPFGSISFPGLTEFRSFDTRIKYGGGRNVENVTLQYGKNIAYLYEDLNRSRTPYLNNFDFNGNFYVDARDANRNTTADELAKDNAGVEVRGSFSYNSRLLDGQYTFLSKDVKADYLEVHFKLKSRPLPEDIYIFGAFTDWKLRPEFKMQYDSKLDLYIGVAQLKQGYYDYMYATTDEEGRLIFEPLEGSWGDTENEYTVITYFREFATRYDRVLNVERFYNTFGQ